MVAPWLTTSKSIAVSGQTARSHPHCPSSGFVPAPLQASMSFPPSKFYAALAKTTALGRANMSVVSALLSSDQALVEALVDDLGSDFLFTSDMAQIGADLRRSLTGRVGAALCHIYLDQLGYAWLDYADQYISTSSPLGDFLYDGANIGSPGLALAEAKGSMTPAASPHQVKARADKAYSRQVDTHLGTSTTAGRIEYGAAVATSILPASAWAAGTSSCFLHVTETASAAQAGQGQANKGGGGSDTGAVDGDDADGTSSVSCRIALRNYRAAFRLIGAPYLVELIDELIDGGPAKTEFEQRFGRLIGPHGPSQWVVGDPGGHPAEDWYNRANRLPFGPRNFALHERSFGAVTNLLRRCGRERELLDGIVRLPNLSRRARFAAEKYEIDRDGPSMSEPPLGDGLAAVRCFGASYPDEENFSWPS
jgi:hypothetical protein